MKKLFTINSRCVILCLLCVTVVSLLTCRLVKIQLLDSDSNQRLAQRDYRKPEAIKAKRGLITDSRDNLLVSNVFTCNLIADRVHLDDPRVAAQGLAYAMAVRTSEWPALDEKGQNKLLKKTYRNIYLDVLKDDEGIEPDRIAIVEDLLARASNAQTPEQAEQAQKAAVHEDFDEEALNKLIRSHEEYAIDIIAQRLKLNKQELLDKLRNSKQKRIPLVQNITEEQMDILQKDLRTMHVDGFTFEHNARRWYHMPKTLSHVLGYTNFEGRGMIGIERSLDRYLAGQDGFRICFTDSRGLLLSSSLDKLKPAVNGLNLKLTIDMNIQSIVEEELEAGMKEMAAERAAVVMVEPHTGNIMAMACRPAFDLNEKNPAELEKGALNFCTQGVYEPGSTFKIVAVSSALDSKKATLNTMIDCGSKTYSEGAITLTDTASYGMRSVMGVVQKSSNIGTYKIAKRAGRAIVVDHLKKFGFGKRTGIDLSSESAGAVRDGENPVDFSRMAIGYAVGVTPIQIAMAYATVANGGVLMKPRLVERIFDSNNKTVTPDLTRPQEVCRVISESAARDMKKALMAVTEQGGTGTRGRIPGFKVGAKTGTARRHVEGKGYMDGQYTVSFAGIVPAEKPAFVCLVVVDNPRTTKVRHYGGTVAGPIFQKIAARTVAALNLTPTEPLSDFKESNDDSH